ncbi:MAG: hypothetical protein IH845_03200 [Nanoarchaeota archaeon]|nr:hypothetical protein [Nanoarchaeota archaeon]
MKRGFVIFLFLVVILVGSVSALSGVSPGSYEVDFVDGLDEEYIFDFTFDEGSESELYVDGPLSEYITLDKKVLFGSGSVVAKLEVGAEALETPGLSRIRIGAKKISDNIEGGVGIAWDVWGIIKVEVPYSGKYIDLEVTASNANVGEEVRITLRAINRGNESVILKSQVQIFKDLKKVDKIVFRNEQISPYETKDYSGVLDTSGYIGGEYVATGLSEYGEGLVSRADTLFKLGELKVLINNYSRSFEGGKISEFNVEIVSIWNNVIESVYAEVNIANYPEASFITSTASLGAWKTVTLKGFFDTNGIKEDEVFAEIIIHYRDLVTTENVNLEIHHGIDYFSYFLTFLILVVILGIIFRIILFIKRYKRLRR